MANWVEKVKKVCDCWIKSKAYLLHQKEKQSKEKKTWAMAVDQIKQDKTALAVWQKNLHSRFSYESERNLICFRPSIIQRNRSLGSGLIYGHGGWERWGKKYKMSAMIYIRWIETKSS